MHCVARLAPRTCAAAALLGSAENERLVRWKELKVLAEETLGGKDESTLALKGRLEKEEAVVVEQVVQGEEQVLVVWLCGGCVC